MIYLKHPELGRIVIYELGEYGILSSGRRFYRNKEGNSIQFSGRLAFFTAMIALSQDEDGNFTIIKNRHPYNAAILEKLHKFLFKNSLCTNLTTVIWDESFEIRRLEKMAFDESIERRFELMDI